MRSDPQPGTSQRLEVISGWLMAPLAYRFFGGWGSLTVTQVVDAGGGQAAARWYEIRDPGPTQTLYQQGTYAPADGVSRWMGRAAQDRSGNLALAYSAGGAATFAGLRYTGRLAADPLGVLPQGEGVIHPGTAA